MQFIHFLNSHLLDPKVGAGRHYAEVLEQAVAADRLGFRGVGIPEHHLVNLLLIPSPLQMAVAIAARTRRVELVTSICQLPIRDMRIFAGEVVQAQALCDGRLMLGVGKGAFGYETGRLGVPMEETKARFEESLAVLEALLTREEVSWDGRWYRFDALTVMPRPDRPIQLQLASMAPEGIEAAARRGYHVQTTPLGASEEILAAQVAAFHRGRAAAPDGGTNRLSLQRGLYLAKNAADARDKLDRAHAYYEKFDNVFGGPGLVDHGVVRSLPRKQTIEELGRNILICERQEMIDKLSHYAELGIDDVISSSNFGQPQAETLDMMERFAAEVMPHVAGLGTEIGE